MFRTFVTSDFFFSRICLLDFAINNLKLDTMTMNGDSVRREKKTYGEKMEK